MSASKGSSGRVGRWVGRLFLLAVLVALGWGAKVWLLTEEPEAPPPTTAVGRADVRETVLASGTLEAKEMVSVGAQVSGQIQSISVELGDRVTAGQTVAQIDSLPQQNALRQSEAALQNVRAQRAAKQAALKQAEREFERQKKMFSRGASSQQDYDAAEAELAATKAEISALNAQIAQAEIEVDTAKVDLGYTKITSPIDGTVVAVAVKVGQTVNANQSTPTIIKVAQLDTMTVKAEISEADVVRVTPGQTVIFTILGEPDRQYETVLRDIEPGPTTYADTTSTSSSSSSSSSSDSAVYYNGLLDIANPEHKLRIDMTAEVSIILREAENALVIPASALSDAMPDGRYQVQVMRPDGLLENRTVTVGINNNIRAEITEGLSEGEQVVSTNMGSAAAAESNERRGPRGPMGF